MAFLRVKKTRGRSYAYLVENRYDPRTRSAHQRVVMYLGRLDRLRPESLPVRYRTPAVVRALESKRREGLEYTEARVLPLREEFLQALLEGDRAHARRVASAAARALGSTRFCAGVLVPALHEVGRRWSEGSISVSDEHLATGVAEGVVSHGFPPQPRLPRSPEVILCVPEGETHAFPLLLAEGFLRGRGFSPLNLGASAPENSLVQFVRERPPHAVLISVTQSQYWEGARRLAHRFHRTLPRLLIAAGGQGAPVPAHREGMDWFETPAEPLEQFLRHWPRSPAGGPAPSLAIGTGAGS